MTIGQLLECVYAQAGALEGYYCDGTPFSESRLPEISRLLTQHGFHGGGLEVMYRGDTGEKQQALIFIGPTFYQVQICDCFLN